jgi:acyl carrier protein
MQDNQSKDTQKLTDTSSTTNDSINSSIELQREVAELMIECLNLEVTADQIAPDSPLYGDGLGLDSIDVLEVALVVSKRYGLQLRDEKTDNQHIFSSLRNLSDYIANKRIR